MTTPHKHRWKYLSNARITVCTECGRLNPPIKPNPKRDSTAEWERIKIEVDW